MLEVAWSLKNGYQTTRRQRVAADQIDRSLVRLIVRLNPADMRSVD